MPYEGLGEFVQKLEAAGELHRVAAPVSCILEIAQITDTLSKREGPAALFERVRESGLPVLTNAFGSMKRMAMALGVSDVSEIARRIEDYIRPQVPQTLGDKVRLISLFTRLLKFPPKRVSSAPCQEVVHDRDASLTALPVLKCWPGDGGRFLTLPMVFTRDPDTGVRNCGMYRMQVFDERTTGMHWHVHHDGARHYRKYEKAGKRMPIAVALGGDPAVTYAATAPMPPDVDEMLFAGFLRNRNVEMVPCKTVNAEVNADAEIVLEGYVEPGERRVEGPFGDHTGYYSPADEYPVFHLTGLTHRKDPIYPATVVGKPPMEDCYMGKATERIFLPLLKAQLPEIVDINLPLFGVFHNFAFVSIDKQYPFHARKVMNAIWGLGQMMFTKVIVVVDGDVDVQNVADVLWKVGNNMDPRRDVTFAEGPIDVLDHASPTKLVGSKMGIDATKKLPEEGHPREWPAETRMSPDIVETALRRWSEYGLP